MEQATPTESTVIVRGVVDELAQDRAELIALRGRYDNLLSAVRTALAVEDAGYLNPMFFIREALEEVGELQEEPACRAA